MKTLFDGYSAERLDITYVLTLLHQILGKTNDKKTFPAFDLFDVINTGTISFSIAHAMR